MPLFPREQIDLFEGVRNGHLEEGAFPSATFWTGLYPGAKVRFFRILVGLTKTELYDLFQIGYRQTFLGP